jgi:hypothetical protein
MFYLLILLNAIIHSRLFIGVQGLDTKFDWQYIEAAGANSNFIRHSFKPQPFNRSLYEMESILVENPIVNEYNASLTGPQIVASYETCSRLPISPNESYIAYLIVLE